MLPELLQVRKISIERPLYYVRERNVSAYLTRGTYCRIFKQRSIYGQLGSGKQYSEGTQMSAIAFDMIFIDTLKLTSIFGPF